MIKYLDYKRKMHHGVNDMQPITTRKTTKELVYDQLKKGILNGTISRKEILTETKLAETLNTSRTPIREATADLLNEGLLVHIPRRGYQVRAIEPHELDQIVYLRSSIEMKGLSLLAKKITEEEIQLLYKIISDQEMAIREMDRITYIELDQTFHRTMLQLAKQNLLEQIFKELYNLSLLIGHAAITTEGRMEEVIEEHQGIVKALEEKDEEKAKKCMQSHLSTTIRRARNMEKKK